MTESKFLLLTGKHIREIRTRKGLTQLELARRCSFQKASLSRIESGKTNLTFATFRKICQALKISPAEFFKAI